MALEQLGSQVVNMASVTTEGSTDTWGLVFHQLYRCLSVIEESEPELPQRAMCVSMVLLLLGSVVMSMTGVAIGVIGIIPC